MKPRNLKPDMQSMADLNTLLNKRITYEDQFNSFTVNVQINANQEAKITNQLKNVQGQRIIPGKWEVIDAVNAPSGAPMRGSTPWTKEFLYITNKSASNGSFTLRFFERESVDSLPEDVTGGLMGGTGGWADILVLGEESGGTNPTISAGDTIDWLDGAFTGQLDTATLSANRSWLLPDTSGTLALTSQLSWANVLATGNTSGGTNALMSTTDRMQFRDTGLYIYSPIDGIVRVVSDNEIGLYPSTRTFTTANFQLDGASEIILGSYAKLSQPGSMPPYLLVTLDDDPDAYVTFQNVYSGGVDLQYFEAQAKQLKLGSGQAGQDYSIFFDGETNDGTITWMEDEALFNFDSGVDLDSTLNVDGTSTFNDDATFQSSVTSTPTIFYDESLHSWVHTINPNGATQHFEISGSETTSPGTNPNYFVLDISRDWSGADQPAVAMQVSIDDNRDISSGIGITTLFNFDYTRTSAEVISSGSQTITGFGMSLSDAGTFSTINPNVYNFDVGGSLNPSWNDTGSRSCTFTGMRFDGEAYGTQAGAGTGAATTTMLDFSSSVTLQAPSIGIGPDTHTIYGLRLRPSGTMLSGTRTFYGIHYDHSLTVSGGTANSYILWAEEDDIVLDSDTSRIVWGEGQDGAIYYDGSDLIIDPDLVGSGSVLIGATGDDDLVMTNLTASGTTTLNTVTYTWPSADATNAGQSLVSNAAGTLSWDETTFIVRKTANETVNNSATPQNDDHLLFSVAANQVYAVSGYLFVSAANSSPGFRCDWTGPTGATATWAVTNIRAGTAPVQTDLGTDGTISLATGANRFVRVHGLFVISSTAGTIQFRWAQNSAHASNTTVLERSYFEVTKL